MSKIQLKNEKCHMVEERIHNEVIFIYLFIHFCMCLYDQQRVFLKIEGNIFMISVEIEPAHTR